VSGLFKGSFAHVFRIAVLNISLTGPYDYLNEKMFLTFGDMSWNVPVSITWASLWASLFTLPIDNLKTRMMRQFSDPSKNRY
jgi:solute carrier family 25 oxoglutarate transporter 11